MSIQVLKHVSKMYLVHTQTQFVGSPSFILGIRSADTRRSVFLFSLKGEPRAGLVP